MAEQSHKREMSDAVRGDFERLRRRLEGTERKAARAQPRPTEPLVLTPPSAPEPEAEAEPGNEATNQPETATPLPGEAAEEVASEPARSRLRSMFRRG